MNKTILRRIFLCGLLSALCCGSALAVSSDVDVQLDGQEIAFTDAQPVAKDGRTYVPFRALFQAMGAEVSYDGATQTVTAARNGKQVAFVLGSRDIQVTENGQTKTATVDAASYAENGRTLVPVRFAAECFGMNVGWDPWYKTVVITDVDKLMQTVSGQFTKMNQYLTYANGLHQKSYDLNGTLDSHIQVTDANGTVIPLETQSQVTGSASHSACQLTLNSQTDLAPLLADYTPEQIAQNQTMLDLMERNQTEVRADLTNNTAYVQSDFYNALGGIGAADWYQTSWESVLSTYSVDANTLALVRMEGDSFEDVMEHYLQSIPVSSREDSRVTEIFQLLDHAFADKYFSQQAGDWTAKGAVTTAKGEIYTIQTTLQTDSDGSVHGYDFTVTSRDGSGNTETLQAALHAGQDLKIACEKTTGNLKSSAEGEFYLRESGTKPIVEPTSDGQIRPIDKLSGLLGW